MGDQAATPEAAKYQERLKRVEDAINLRESDRLPVAPFFASVVQRLYDSSYRDLYYDFTKAGEAYLKFYRNYPLCDGHYCSGFTSGRANELAGSTMIDWPGRPGTVVSNYSSHQVLEHAYLQPEEYGELLGDFTGFMIRKYIPRVYSNLKDIGGIDFTPTVVLSTGLLKPLYSPEMLKVYETLTQIGKLDAEATAALLEYTAKLGDMGFPGMFCGVSEVPYDILGDYFRGTVGIMEDLLEYEDEIAAACDMFADQQIASMQFLRFAPLPVKRIFFPMHKGMDGLHESGPVRKALLEAVQEDHRRAGRYGRDAVPVHGGAVQHPPGAAGRRPQGEGDVPLRDGGHEGGQAHPREHRLHTGQSPHRADGVWQKAGGHRHDQIPDRYLRAGRRVHLRLQRMYGKRHEGKPRRHV